MPDTLLLAEAFWLMEGYFVRTLGMHRVYNSAFMNMLKNEENANFRSVMKNTLEFNPEILKRFVNFMNNPDEETAVAQFGKGDKYFGVCTLMATLPGLPMFGHGQVEGFTEKYGMEYRRAYWDEQPDGHVVHRHERQIFPLLRRRHLFAEVEQFYLYDLFTAEGYVNEDVFAYSNRAAGGTGEGERALVVYHNKYSTARGWIRTSVGYLGKTGRGEERVLMQKSLGEALGLHPGDDHFCIFRDHVTGLEYIRNNKELCDKGLYVDLAAYEHHVFLDFRQVRDHEWPQYAHLTAFLDGRGVPSVDEALKEVFLRPIHHPFKELVNANLLQQLLEARVTDPQDPVQQSVLDTVEPKLVHLLRAMKQFSGGSGDEAALAREVRQRLDVALQLPILESRYSWPASDDRPGAADYLKSNLRDDPRVWGCLFSWVFVHSLGRIAGEKDAAERTRSWLDEWLLGRIIAAALRDLGLDDAAAAKSVQLIKLLTSHQRWFENEAAAGLPAYRVLEALLKDSEGQQFLRVNRFQDILWFTGEAFEELLWWLFLVAVVQGCSEDRGQGTEVLAYYSVIQELQGAAQQAGHQVEKLLEAVKG
jgi:hypothetical protein